MPRLDRRLTTLLCFGPLGLGGCQAQPTPDRVAPAKPAASQSNLVSARGRLQPMGRVLRISGPSDFVAVVSRLEVEEGDHVSAGDVLGIMDTQSVRRARVLSLDARLAAQQAAIGRLEAELENAQLECDRHQRLAEQGILAEAELDAWRTRLAVAEARLEEAHALREAAAAQRAVARAEAELAVVRAPRNGQVLEVHARAGEKVGAKGILDLGATDQLYAIAEVYEMDVLRVTPGQRARVSSPALPSELEGTVERVGLRVGRLESMGADPTRNSDARVVEVEVRLDDGASVAQLTDLEVEVLIAE
jgi:HlyD family secretion protein